MGVTWSMQRDGMLNARECVWEDSVVSNKGFELVGAECERMAVLIDDKQHRCELQHEWCRAVIGMRRYDGSGMLRAEWVAVS
jgi:hypothetical protein